MSKESMLAGLVEDVPGFFDNLWTLHALAGRVDWYGGEEYRRVRAAWDAAGQPVEVLWDWILVEANRRYNRDAGGQP